VSPSNQALSAGTAAAAAQIARTRRTVTSLPGCQAWMSASSTRVVGTTLLCASAMTRAMFRRTPRSCSGWPLALTEGGRVRIGRPLAESAVRCAALRVLPPRPSPAGGEGAAGDWRKSAAPFPARGGGLGCWPAAAVPSAAARFTSAIVTTPSAPVPVTRLRSTRSLRASARTAGIALTPPTESRRSLCTASEDCIAPTTVPLSARSPPASDLRSGGGTPASSIAPPSLEATTRSSGAGSCVPTPLPAGRAPWWWPVSWPSARCGIEGSTSNSASIAPVAMTSPGPPPSLSTLPETGEGTSTTALAVSIDTRLSSRRTVSPTLTYHSTMVASGRPSPRSGRRKVFLLPMSMPEVSLVWIGGRPRGRERWRCARAAHRARRALRGRQRALRRFHDARGGRHVLHLQLEQRHVGIVAGDALDRRQQVVHRFAGQARRDLGAEARGLRCLVHDHAAAGAGHRLGDGGEVQRLEGGDVDHLGADAFGLELLGGLQRLLHLRAPCDQGDVA